MKNYKSYFKVFLSGFVIMFLTMLPIIILNKGYFIYMGDYNYQNIIFSAHCYELIRSGFSMWDSVTGLGNDTIASYSHIIITPFFWFLMLMPTVKAAILALPVVMSLKTAAAMLTSYIYIRRYTQTDRAAFIGSVMYAFSGFQSFSFVFGSFHDITALFPLMLICLDEFMLNDRKGWFMFIVAVMSTMSAFFFYGQVFFIIIYFCVKCITREYNFKLKKFFGLFIESLAGVLISGFVLYPSFLILSSNSRVSSFINGLDAVSYHDRSIPFRILQSIFMMPDKAGATSLFEYSGNNAWSSLSLYLPVFGIIFVYSYIRKHMKKTFSVVMIISFICAMIPFLNSMFYMFNSEYYARWFYMPILIMAAATAVEIESEDYSQVVGGIKFSAVCMLILAFIACLPAKVNEKIGGDFSTETIEKIKFFAFCQDPIYFWRMLGLAGLGILSVYLINEKYNKNKIRNLTVLCISGVLCLNIIYYFDDRGEDTSANDYDGAYLKKPDLSYSDIADDEFFRINGDSFNANILWNMAALNDFITITPSSVGEFYDAFDIPFVQYAHIDYRYYPVNSLMSVKYYLNPSTKDELNVEYYSMKTEGFSEIDEQPCYHIYENQAYIPMGFMYDNCIKKSNLDNFTEEYEKSHPVVKENKNEPDSFFAGIIHAGESKYNDKYLQKMLVLMRAMVLSDDDAEKYKDILPEISDDDISALSKETYYSDSSDRADNSCSEFKFDGSSFTAKIESDRENLVFFSVPYMDGWKAKVNGKDAEIIKANYGFMAVKVDAGENDIVFSYTNDAYKTGALISAAGLLIFAVYMLINISSDRKRRKAGTAA